MATSKSKKKNTNTAVKKEPFKAVTLRSKNDQLSFMKKKMGEHLERYKQCSAQVSEKCKKNHGMSLVDNYYHSDHDEFNGKFPICKDCLTEMTSNSVGELSRKGLAMVCPVLNIPFLQDVYESALNGKGFSLGVYIRIILANHNDERFVDSDSDIVNFQQDADNDYDTSDIVVSDELYLKWGAYHPKEDIISLEYNYNRYVNAYQIEGIVEEKLVKKACLLELQEEKSMASGKSTKDISKQWSDTIGMLKLKPDQQNKESDKHTKLGNIASLIEEGKPIVNKDPAFEDVDGMMWYINNFFSQIFKAFGKSKINAENPSKKSGE